MSGKTCVRCGDTATRTCSVCYLQHFCSQKCANEHWVDGRHANDHLIFVASKHNSVNVMDLIVGSGKPGEGSVYLGGIESLQHLNHIDAVVSALEPDYKYGEARDMVKEQEKLDGKKRHHLRITLWDSHDANIAEYFDRVADFVELHVFKGKHVLIHCVAGMSRSASLLLYYMHKYAGYNDLDRALEHVQAIRPIVHPNSSFMKQLQRAYNRPPY